MRLILRVKSFDAPGPAHWIGWENDEQIVNHYAPDIQKVMSRMASGLRSAIAQAQDSYRTLPVSKAPTSASQGQSAIAGQVSAQAVDSNVTVDQAQLEAIVAAIYGDSYLIGTHAAANLLPDHQAVLFLSALDQAVDWVNWKPGNPEAALQAADGGLSRLLAARGIVIRGISGTTLDELGNKIAQGLENGDSTDTIYQVVRGYVDNPVRATMIARTETARAVTASAFETYQEANIAEWIWMAAPNACPICLQNSIGGPYPIGGGPYMPAHPQCRCAAGPFIDI